MAIRLRARLRRNKIFFETTAATPLSAMALLVSIGSMKISSTQTRIQQALAEPTFVVRPEPILNPETRKFEELRFAIRNVGAPARAFTESVTSFIRLHYTGRLHTTSSA